MLTQFPWESSLMLMFYSWQEKDTMTETKICSYRDFLLIITSHLIFPWSVRHQTILYFEYRNYHLASWQTGTKFSCMLVEWRWILHYPGKFSSVQSLSRVRLFATPWITAHQASLSITNSWSSPRLASIESVMPSSHLILCHPLLLLPPISPSIRVFSNESTLRMR